MRDVSAYRYRSCRGCRDGVSLTGEENFVAGEGAGKDSARAVGNAGNLGVGATSFDPGRPVDGGSIGIILQKRTPQSAPADPRRQFLALKPRNRAGAILTPAAHGTRDGRAASKKKSFRPRRTHKNVSKVVVANKVAVASPNQARREALAQIFPLTPP